MSPSPTPSTEFTGTALARVAGCGLIATVRAFFRLTITYPVGRTIALAACLKLRGSRRTTTTYHLCVTPVRTRVVAILLRDTNADFANATITRSRAGYTTLSTWFEIPCSGPLHTYLSLLP